MPKVIVGLMGSSVAKGSSSITTPAQLSSFLTTIKSHPIATELDTARVYNSGQSEVLLGQVLTSTPSFLDTFKISTKAPGFSPGKLTEPNILQANADSLSALQLPRCEIYYIHGPDRQTPLEEQCRAFNTLHQQNKFTKFGLSNLSDAEVQEIHAICQRENYVLPTVYQGGYSPLHRGAEKTLLPLLRSLNMTFYAFSPLAGGLLAKPLSDILNPKQGSRYQAMPAFRDIFINDTVVAGLTAQTRLCEKHGISIMEATMRWFMHHSPLGEEDGVIVGASTDRQVDSSLAACEKGPLPDEVATGFETMWEDIKEAAPGYHA